MPVHTALLPLAAASPARRSRPPLAAGVFSFAAVSALSTWFSITLTRFDGGVAALWIANGLLTGTLLLTPRRHWRWWCLAAAAGQLGARLFHGASLWLAVAVVAINLLESGIVAGYVRRGSRALGEGRSLGGMAGDAALATVVACVVSATLVTPIVRAHVDTTAATAWVSWFMAHLMGMTMFATLTVCALAPQVGVFGRADKRLEYVLCLALLAVTSYGVFWQVTFPLLYVTYLPLMYLVWRQGLSGMMAGVMVLAGASGLAVSQHAGPFAMLRDATPLTQILCWQSYIAAACVLAYSTSVSMAGRRLLERKLQASEQRYRQLAEGAERLARVDALTGLANRRQFDEELAHALARSSRTGAALMLLALDLDHFKQVNDRLGHAAGDEVLREFARRVRSAVYDVDLVARLGGDEFVVLVEYSAHADAGGRMATHILAAMEPPIVLSDGRSLQIGTSVGIGVLDRASSGAQLMALADKALYEAKASGRNTWAICRE
jgi:diguanylate cyclase (GGDEF)-like protein